jgi:hypothetical protein
MAEDDLRTGREKRQGEEMARLAAMPKRRVQRAGRRRRRACPLVMTARL